MSIWTYFYGKPRDAHQDLTKSNPNLVVKELGYEALNIPHLKGI